MSLNYKNVGIVKKKKTKPTKDYALDIPPQENIPGWVQEISKLKGTGNEYYD